MGENIKAMPTGHVSGELQTWLKLTLKPKEFGIKINLI